MAERSIRGRREILFNRSDFRRVGKLGSAQNGILAAPLEMHVAAMGKLPTRRPPRVRATQSDR